MSERLQKAIAAAGDRRLGVNEGALWFYELGRDLSASERMYFRAAVADPRETRSLTVMFGAAIAILAAQKPHLFRERA